MADLSAVYYARIPQNEASHTYQNGGANGSAAVNRVSTAEQPNLVSGSDWTKRVTKTSLCACILIIACLAILIAVVWQHLNPRTTDFFSELEVQNVSEDESEPLAELIPPRSNSLKVSELCSNWTPEFTARYEKECGFWLQEFRNWDEQAGSTSKTIAYSCPDPSECRGWGDRLGGIQSAFQKALAERAHFRIAHPGLQNLFSPCLLGSKATNWAAHPKDFEVYATACKATPATHCAAWNTLECRANVIATEKTDRACLNGDVCGKIHAHFYKAPLHPARVFGCGLKAMFEPSETLNGMKLPFKMGAEPKRELSLREIVVLFRDYYIIGVHFRMGDSYAFFNNAGDFDLDEERYARPFRCAKTLESHLFARDGMTIQGKPVKWFVTSDSYRLKRLAGHAFPDRVMYLDLKPQHVALKTKDEDLSNTIAEWHLIGLSNQLVVNKIGTEHGDFYHGRVSAFPKTTWITQLKHLVFDAGTCRQFSLPFEGIWEDQRTKLCGRESVASKRPAFLRQDHLKPLTDRNLTFPNYYVDMGRIVPGDAN